MRQLPNTIILADIETLDTLCLGDLVPLQIQEPLWNRTYQELRLGDGEVVQVQERPAFPMKRRVEATLQRLLEEPELLLTYQIKGCLT